MSLSIQSQCTCRKRETAERKWYHNPGCGLHIRYYENTLCCHRRCVCSGDVWIASLVALINRCLDRNLIGGTSCSVWQLSPPIKSCHKTHVCSTIAGGFLLFSLTFLSSCIWPLSDKMPQSISTAVFRDFETGEKINVKGIRVLWYSLCFFFFFFAESAHSHSNILIMDKIQSTKDDCNCPVI